jgi:hypothetical protein
MRRSCVLPMAGRTRAVERPNCSCTLQIVTYQPVRPVVPGGFLVTSVFDQAHDQADRQQMFTKCN